MSKIDEDVIEEYFETLVTYHNGLFGVSQRADIKEVNYIYKIERIFSFIDLLQKIDDSMHNDFLDIILHDIVKLLQQRSLSTKNSYKIELGFVEFTKKYNASLNDENIYKMFIPILKKYKPLLDKLLNTKFFYLDKYLCYQISESKKLQYFLGTKGIVNLKSIMEYVNEDTEDSFMKLDYNFFGVDTVYPYEENQVKYIKSLAKKQPKEEENKALEQLIQFKKHIHFFDNLDDEDIRNIVTDVTFKHYKPKETVIREKDTSIDIYFLVSGECRIMLQGQEMGIIEKQSIFGEFAFITRERRSASVRTTEDSVIISFNFDLYSFDENPCIYSKLYNNISNILVKKLTNQNQVQGYD